MGRSLKYCRSCGIHIHKFYMRYHFLANAGAKKAGQCPLCYLEYIYQYPVGALRAAVENGVSIPENMFGTELERAIDQEGI